MYYVERIELIVVLLTAINITLKTVLNAINNFKIDNTKIIPLEVHYSIE